MCDERTADRDKTAAANSYSDFAETTRNACLLAGTKVYGNAAVIEKDVSVAMPDGAADSVVFYPDDGLPRAAVLIWVDVLGLRQVYREIGRRLASFGYVVLVPNAFYRSATAADIVRAAYDFAIPEDRATLFEFREQITDGGAVEDSVAYLAFLDAQPQVDPTKGAGVHGYCIGGPLSFRTAAAVPRRIAAVGSFHGNGLVTQEPSSPHVLIAGTDAPYLVAIADDDDGRDPAMKDVLRRTFDETGKQATVEVYSANHGWCVPDGPIYDPAAAEKAWAELLELYGRALV